MILKQKIKATSSDPRLGCSYEKTVMLLTMPIFYILIMCQLQHFSKSGLSQQIVYSDNLLL